MIRVRQADQLLPARAGPGQDARRIRRLHGVVLDRGEDQQRKHHRGQLGVGRPDQSSELVGALQRDPVVYELIRSGLLDVVADALHAPREQTRQGSQDQIRPARHRVDRDHAAELVAVLGPEVQSDASPHREADHDDIGAAASQVGEAGLGLTLPVLPGRALEVLPGRAVAGQARAHHRHVVFG